MSAVERTRPTIEEEASATFLRRLRGGWTAADQATFEALLERDPAYADAYRRVSESWRALAEYAESAEIMRYREEAFAYGRRHNSRQWFRAHAYGREVRRAAAAVIGVISLLGIAWQLSPYGYSPGRYQTGTGEQRVVDLEDRSRIVLDAGTRLRVRFSPYARIVELQDGQAQFFVAKDPARPFRVEAGGRTIVAVGTVFIVEYIDSQVHVAMMEGKVAVVPNAPSQANDGVAADISLVAGEELTVSRDGRSTVTQKADLEATTAWRSGKVVIRSEPLAEAVERMNRYSQLKMKIDDPTLAELRISGVFEAGDTQAFVSAIQRYLPVAVDYGESPVVKLRLK